MEVVERRCEFWLPNKRRFCANAPLQNSSFCGNHNPSAKEERVPCPIDPSHFVSKINLASHVKRCPLKKQAADLESQPFYHKGINSGLADTPPFVSSEEKRRSILSLTVPELCRLVRKIESVHSSIAYEIRDSYTIPEACRAWIGQMRERQLPFQEKHVLQQASILGSMERFGVLEREAAGSGMSAESCSGSCDCEVDVPAVVEFGAGRGYLTHMLADCYGMRKVFLVERRSYKLKADRSLRQNKNMRIERLRIDIEDLNLNEVANLKGHPYLAVGKHICGPATDLTLRCCLPEHYNGNLSDVSSQLKGLAIATCCHHLCQWQQYTNKKFLEDVGLTEDDFHAVTWFSSWAVDADHSSSLLFDFNHDKPPKAMLLTESEMGDKDVETIIRGMKPLDRAIFGFLCKEIIDIGRLLWLHEQGLEAQLVKYVANDISPENHLLIAKCSNKC